MASAFDPVASKEPFHSRWWLAKGDAEVAVSAVSVYEALREQDAPRQDRDLHHYRLYGNTSSMGFHQQPRRIEPTRDTMSLNVVANVCDTATARVGSIRPIPKPQTVNGNRSLQRKARLLERFFQSQFRISGVHKSARAAFRDATIAGTGTLKVYEEADQIRVERILGGELLVDHYEALHGEPRQIMQRKLMSRDVLREMFVKKSAGAPTKSQLRTIEAIDNANIGPEDDGFLPVRESGVHDQVLVIEAWHLPSGPDAKDGKHIIVTTAGPLLVEEWKHDYFPFVFFHWKESPRGFWGTGIAEEINGVQVEINRILRKIQLAFKKVAVPRVFIDAGSKINKSHINDEIGAFVPYVGKPPIVSVPQTIHPEMFSHLGWLYERAFEIPGLSQDSASPGFQGVSGISASTQHEISTERFRVQLLDYEEAFIEIARQMVDRAKDIHARTKSFGFPAEVDRGTVDFLDWSDVEMKNDEYVLHKAAQSALPTLPGPRTDRVRMLIEMGAPIPPEAILELLDMPDLDKYMSLDRAAADDISRIVESILDEGIYEPPEPYMDLQLALKRGQAELNRARARGAQVEEDNIDLLRLWLTEVHKLQQKAAMEQQKLSMAAGAEGGAISSPQAPAAGAPPAPGSNGAPPTAVQPNDGVPA